MKLRIIILKLHGMKIGKETLIYGGFEIRGARNIEIGNNSIIGFNCTLDGRMGLKIGSNVNFGSEVMVWSLQHDLNDSEFKGSGSSITVEDRAWLSTRSIILPGRNIGTGGVVAAGAVVVHDVEPFTVVGGNPAKVIGTRSKDLTYKLGKEKMYFV